MTTVEKDGYIFSVDIERTQAYYRTHSLCDCACCRNFYALAKISFPELDTFLSQFGVDIARPDEIGCVEEENQIDYTFVAYTVCGKLESMGEYEIDVYDGPVPASIVVTNGFSSPNEQTGDYFTLTVMQLKLPFVLDEPFPEPIPIPKRSRLFSKLFKT